MLKSFYKTLDEIPEGDRQHYKKIGDRYVLELDGEHPVQAQVTTITEEKRTELAKANQRAATAEAEVETLKTQAANSPTLPAGHVPVPADRAKLLDAIEGLGEGADLNAKVENIKTKVAEYPNLTTKVSTLEKAEQLRKVADSGINGKKLKVSVLQTLDAQAGPAGLTYEEREISVNKDGKTTTEKQWHVKDNNKWVPLSEYSDTHWKDFTASLIAEETPAGTRVAGGVADANAKSTNFYDDLRKNSEERRKQEQAPQIPLEKRLNMVN